MTTQADNIYLPNRLEEEFFTKMWGSQAELAMAPWKQKRRKLYEKVGKA